MVRFQRIGRPGVARFRLVAQEKRISSKSPALEVLGAYNPAAEDGKKIANLKKERLDHWLRMGAQLSPAADKLLRKEKHLPELAPAPAPAPAPAAK
jgi:small subunit ribosomal protein S16